MLGASWIAGVAAVWLLHIGQFGSCDVRGTGGRACWRLVAGWPGQRLAAGGGSASSGSLTQAEKTESPGQPLGLGSWFPGSGRRRRPWRGDARSVRWPCGYWPGSARSHLGSPLGADWSCTLRGRHYACAVGRVPCPQGSPRRIRGFRRCLSRSQLAAPLVLLPLDDAGRRDRKHVHTGRRPREGHRVPDWCRLSMDTRVTGIAGIPARRSS
jgi:hypothetical protein